MHPVSWPCTHSRSSVPSVWLLQHPICIVVPFFTLVLHRSALSCTPSQHPICIVVTLLFPVLLRSALSCSTSPLSFTPSCHPVCTPIMHPGCERFVISSKKSDKSQGDDRINMKANLNNKNWLFHIFKRLQAMNWNKQLFKLALRKRMNIESRLTQITSSRTRALVYFVITRKRSSRTVRYRPHTVLKHHNQDIWRKFQRKIFGWVFFCFCHSYWKSICKELKFFWFLKTDSFVLQA